jgi:subtilisin family serine protease
MPVPDLPDDDVPQDGEAWDRWTNDRVLICPSDTRALAAQLDELSLGLELLADGVAVVDVPWDLDAYSFMRLMDVLEKLDGACAAEPDYLFRTPEGTHSNKIVVGSTFGRSDFKQQAALRRLRVKSAHAVATARGRGVVVAVLDSGIDRDHPAVRGHVLPGYDFVDSDGDPAEERNDWDDDLDGAVDEGYGHGTFVAGLLLAVAPDAEVLPLRVLDDEGRGSASSIAAAIAYAVDQGAEVINLSLGMETRSVVVEEQIRAAIDAGVTVVAAAGNNGRRTKLQFPANVEGVVSVTSLGTGRRRAGWADGRASASVAVPGRGTIGPYPGGRWGRSSGTSFSAALVSGAAAIVRSHRPRLDSDAVRDALTDRTRLRINRLVK